MPSHTTGQDQPAWPSPTPVRVVVVAILALAALVRLWAAQDEFWMDEIWSLIGMEKLIRSPLDILTAHHDNNHYLITLWMYLVSPQANWFVYRLPSVLAGIGTVAAAAYASRRWGAPAVIAASLLTAASFVLIVYASEARGYALAGFFAVVAFLALDRFLSTRAIAANLTFAAATILGTLSHLTFVQFYLGALAWSLVSLSRSRQPSYELGPNVAAARRTQRASKGVASNRDETTPPWQQRCVWIVGLHAVPLCFLAALYLIDVRYLQFGGGDSYVLSEVLAKTAVLAVGGYVASPPVVVLAIGLEAVIATVGCYWLWREKSDLWIFFLCGFLLAPAVLMAVRPPRVLHERYFYLNILFFLILACYVLSRLSRLGQLGQAVAWTAACAFVVANAWLTSDFLRVGRGHFHDALVYMAEHTPGPDIRMAGDAEFGYALYSGFYSPYLPPGKRFLLQKLAPEMPEEPEWIMFTSERQPWSPDPSIRDADGREAYRLVEVFRYAGLSGAHFALYRRVPDRAPAANGK